MELPVRTAPRIAVVGDQYFIIVEQLVVSKVDCFVDALFVMSCCYYVFNLQYPKNIKNVMYFLQDHIFSHPDSLTRPPTFISYNHRH